MCLCKEQLSCHCHSSLPGSCVGSGSLRESPALPPGAGMTDGHHIWIFTQCWGSNSGPHAGPTPVTFYRTLHVLPPSRRSTCFTEISVTGGQSTWGSPSASSLLSLFRLEPRPARESQLKALDIIHPLLIPCCPTQVLMAAQSPWLPVCL